MENLQNNYERFQRYYNGTLKNHHIYVGSENLPRCSILAYYASDLRKSFYPFLQLVSHFWDLVLVQCETPSLMSHMIWINSIENGEDFHLLLQAKIHD